MKHFLTAILLATIVIAAPPSDKNLETPLTKITYGSCYGKKHGTPEIWDDVLKEKSDLWIWLGDNVYADPKHDIPAASKEEIEKAYEWTFGDDELYAKIAKTTPIIATWDDHDYGKNDGGAEYPLKEESKEVFLDYFQEPADSIRRKREGIYTSYTFGKEGERVQILLLDLRTFRSPLIEGEKKRSPFGGEFIPNPDPDAKILGEEQWAWLSEELEKPADLRLIGSSIQFVSEFDGWEAWANFPLEKKKLISLIKEKKAEGVIFISGDSHKGELHLEEPKDCYSLWDLTSSGVNQGLRHTESQTLCGKSYGKANYGVITIDWKKKALLMEIKDTEGETVLSHNLLFSELTFKEENTSPAPLENALGEWNHRNGTFFIEEKEGTFLGNYSYKDEKGALTLKEENGILVGTWERGGNTRKCRFIPTRAGKYLLGTHSKSLDTECLWDWNGWKSSTQSASTLPLIPEIPFLTEDLRDQYALNESYPVTDESDWDFTQGARQTLDLLATCLHKPGYDLNIFFDEDSLSHWEEDGVTLDYRDYLDSYVLENSSEKTIKESLSERKGDGLDLIVE